MRTRPGMWFARKFRIGSRLWRISMAKYILELTRAAFEEQILNTARIAELFVDGEKTYSDLARQVLQFKNRNVQYMSSKWEYEAVKARNGLRVVSRKSKVVMVTTDLE